MADNTKTATVGPAADPALAATIEPGPAERSVEGLASGHLGGRYRVKKLLGAGGMGAVFLVVDEVLGQEFALKKVTRHVDLERLRSEVLLAQKITHPNVCRTWDLEELDGNFFVKMEFVDGENLAERLRREKKLPAAETLRIAREVCMGLAAAHARGVIHCDLKPHNILVEKNTSRIVLTDFGVARAADENRPVGGTPHYMAPEQVRGLPVDGRTDLYGLGCVLHQLLTGEVPFPAASSEEAARRQLDDPPPKGTKLVARLLQKDPAARPASANEVLALLDAPRRRKLRLIIAASALAVIAAVSFVTWRATRRPPEWRPKIVERQPAYDETTDFPVISPDGKWLAYASDRDGPHRVFVEPIDGGPARVVVSGDTPIGLRWARDGSAFLGTTFDNQFRRYPLDGSAPSVMVEGVRHGDACGDGMVITYTTSPGCQTCSRLVYRAADGAERELARAAPNEVILFPRCDRGGRKVAYVKAPPFLVVTYYALADLWVTSTDGGAPRRLTHDGRHNLHPVFAPDGRSVIFSSARSGRRNLWELSVAGGEPRQLTFGEGDDVSPDVTPDGRRVIFDNNVMAAPLYAWPLDGHEPPRKLTAALAGVGAIHPLPDGRTLAALVVEDAESHAVLISTESAPLRDLGPATAILPDGKALLVAVPDRDGTRIERVSLAGEGQREVRAHVAGTVGRLASDAGVLFASAIDAAGPLVWRIAPDGTAAPLRGFHHIVPAPAGGWTATIPALGSSGGLALLRLIAPGRPLDDPAALTLHIAKLVWEPSGQAVVYANADGVRRRDLVTGEDRSLLSVRVPRSIAISPDGRTLYYSVIAAHGRREWLANFAERPPL
jgi:predicted Ser/Thr protein kinase